MKPKTLIALLFICAVVTKSSATNVRRKIVRNKKVFNRLIHKGRRQLYSSKEPTVELKSTASPKKSTKSPKFSTKAPKFSTKAPKFSTKSPKTSTKSPKSSPKSPKNKEIIERTKSPKSMRNDDNDDDNDNAPSPVDDVTNHAFSDRISFYLKGIIVVTAITTWII